VFFLTEKIELDCSLNSYLFYFLFYIGTIIKKKTENVKEEFRMKFARHIYGSHDLKRQPMQKAPAVFKLS